MLVTAIEPGRKFLSALYIDGELAVKLDTETLLTERLKPGDEIDDDQLFELIFKSDCKRAKERAMWLISYRDYSEKELSQKLSKDFSEQAVNTAVQRLKELGLIDDEVYAKRYAESLSLKHLSSRQIAVKLRQKGIDRDLTEEAVEDLSLDEKDEIRCLITKKYFNKLSDEDSLRRTVAALQRRGFSYSDIKSVLEEFADIEDA